VKEALYLASKKATPCACQQGLCKVTGTHCEMMPLDPKTYESLCAGQALINEANKKCQLIQSKLDVSESKLEALERLLSNPATQYYCSLNSKMLVTRMRSIIKGEHK